MGNSSSRFHVDWNDRTKEIDDKTRHILLVGLSGQGKSSTGNTILGLTKGNREFKQGGGWNSMTKDSYVSSTMIDGIRYDVTDMPGYNDNKVTASSARQHIVATAIAKSLMACPFGFHAILLVVSYGRRLSNDDVQCMRELICLIGEEAFEKKGILVVTRGHDFEEEEDSPFHEWIKMEQSSPIHGKIFAMFGTKCVLLENKPTTDQRSKQLKRLIQEVQQVGLRTYIPEACRYRGDKMQLFLDEHDQMMKVQAFSNICGLVCNAVATKKRIDWERTLDERIQQARALKMECVLPKYKLWIEHISICFKNLEEIKQHLNNPNEQFQDQIKKIRAAQFDIYNTMELTFYYEAIKLNVLQDIANYFSLFIRGKIVY